MTFSQTATVSSENKRAIIVGGGPAGTLMALYLAQMNWNVAVYERRDCYAETQEGKTRRNYNIVLSPRGLMSLKKAGVTLAPEDIVVIKANIRHTDKRIKKSPSFSESVSIKRNILAQRLFEEGINRFPSQIQYYFGHHLKDIDFSQKVATFTNEQKEISQEFDLLVGADGVFSTVREIMAKEFAQFQYQQNLDQMTFKICQLGKATALSGAKEDWGECFHTWPTHQPVTILAPPSPDGCLNGVLIMPQEGEITFEKIKSKEDVESLFRSKFPDIFLGKSIPQELVQDLLEQKIAYGGITTVCNSFHLKDAVVLIGDAAHSIWPSLGQGCNAALESCHILAENLMNHNSNLKFALPAYNLTRKPDTDAIGRMSEQGFGGNKRAGNTLFFAKIIALSLLHKLLPQIFSKPALLKINQADVGYAQIESEWKGQQRQLLAIVIVLVVMVILIIIFVFNSWFFS